MPHDALGRGFLCLTVLTLAVYVGVHGAGLIDAPIHSDGYSYYVYLPAFFLAEDPSLQAVADDCCGGSFPAFTSIIRWPSTGRWVNPHPIGTALWTTPFFAIAHLLTRWSNLPPDGFSLYYQHAAGLAGVAAFLAGIAVLGHLLRRHFRDAVVLATLAGLALGTNLLNYATYDATFSHAFSFLLIALLLDATDRWWRNPVWTASLELAVVAALIFLTRHANILFLAIVPLWNPGGVWARRRQLLAMAGLALFCVTPQLVLYKQATGHWFVSVYGELGRFDFVSPRLAAVLFGVRKGLFFWSPLLLFALAGAAVGHPLARRLRPAAALTFILNAYLIASWSDWQFGASFGHRGFTDSLPIAAVFLAACFDWVSRRRRLVAPVAAVATLLVALSLVQMTQYWLGILPAADTTWAQYRGAFLRFR